jgi:hypothetical protein
MSRLFSLIALFSLLLTAESALADGFLLQLPKDGTRATYTLTGMVKDGPASGPADNISIDGSFQIASVGQATEKDQPCRWIEIKFEMGGAAKDKNGRTKLPVQTFTYKLLIPEKYLVKGESPLDHVVRAWQQNNQEEATELKNPKDFLDGPLAILLAGPMKDEKKLDKAEVDCKLGEKLACEGVSGTMEVKHGPTQVKCTLEYRVLDKSPFGVVASTWKLEADDTDMMECNMVLSDVSEDAKSELPDKN